MAGRFQSCVYSDNLRTQIAKPAILIHTDATNGKLGTSSAIIAAKAIEPKLLSSDGNSLAALAGKPDHSWQAIFSAIAYIDAIQLLAVAAAVDT